MKTINGNCTIQMSIYPLTNDIVGSYYYDDKEIEIMLEGKAGAKDIILLEYDGEVIIQVYSKGL